MSFANIHRQKTSFFSDLVQNTLICGIPAVTNARIHRDENGIGIMAEGLGYREILGIRGVDARRSTCNSTHEMADVLGIEAARQSIINELQLTMESHGMQVDLRHFSLLADLMCHQGQVLGITRHGMAKMRSSPLKLASFEVTLPALAEAGFFGVKQDMRGVTESIVSGGLTYVGSGVPKMVTRRSVEDEVEIVEFERDVREERREKRKPKSRTRRVKFFDESDSDAEKEAVPVEKKPTNKPGSSRGRQKMSLFKKAKMEAAQEVKQTKREPVSPDKDDTSQNTRPTRASRAKRVNYSK